MVWLVLLAILGMAFLGAMYMAEKKGAAEENAKDIQATANNLEKAKDAADDINRLSATDKRKRLRTKFGK